MKVDPILLSALTLSARPPEPSAPSAAEPSPAFERALQRAQRGEPRGEEPLADPPREPPAPETPAMPQALSMWLPPRTAALEAAPLAGRAASPALILAQAQGARWQALPDLQPLHPGSPTLRLQLLGSGLPVQSIELQSRSPGTLQLQIHSSTAPPLAMRELLRTRLEQRGQAATHVEWRLGEESPEEASEP